VLDPMVGSGSTAIAAHILGRRYIGIDISREYCALAEARIAGMQSNMAPGFKNAESLRAGRKMVAAARPSAREQASLLAQ